MSIKPLLPIAIAVSLAACASSSNNVKSTTTDAAPKASPAAKAAPAASATMAKKSTGNKVASITDTDSSDTGELRYVFGSGMKQGRVSLSVLYAEGEKETLGISLFDSKNSTKSLIGELRMDTGKYALRNNNAQDFKFPSGSDFTEGKFVDVVMTWNTSDASKAGSYTVSVDGKKYGPFIAENETPGVEVKALSLRLSSNSKTAKTAVLVDNIAVYADEAGTKKVFSEDFEGYNVGASLKAKPFDSKTFSAVVVGQ
ncbi:hypothetical protein EOL70_11550 [Leucothrix sargassi]|nr:hypothetical protein EOL70_11550 [Leucothrix sargassi]